MKRLLPLLLVVLISAATAVATDQLRDVQVELKNQGFFYGELDGKPSAELNAAIRRYQIRNGLEVTGELNDPTMKALGLSENLDQPSLKDPDANRPPVPAPKPAKPAQIAPPPASKPPVHLRKDESVQESDRRALEQERAKTERPRDRAVVRPPSSLDEPTDSEPSEEYGNVFNGTPYQSAPKVVQEQTVKRAQSILRSRGFYRDDIDGDPGPAMEEALLSFQRRLRLPLTGRLDLQTLALLDLLPGRSTRGQRMTPYDRAPDRSVRQQAYRGIWVQ